MSPRAERSKHKGSWSTTPRSTRMSCARARERSAVRWTDHRAFGSLESTANSSTHMKVLASNDGRTRCPWSNTGLSEAYVRYHDEEWGVPVHDDPRSLSC